MRYIVTRNNDTDPIFDGLFDDWDIASRKFPPVDVYDEGGQFVLVAELPGYDEKDLDMHVENHVLHIVSHAQLDKEAEGKRKYLVHERSTPSFERSFSLPENVKEDAINASYVDGLLTIKMPKVQPAAPQRIAVAIKH